MYVLKDLWEGNITPADRGYRKGSPYARLIHQANESEDEFYNHLSDAGKKAYQVSIESETEDPVITVNFASIFLKCPARLWMPRGAAAK